MTETATVEKKPRVKKGDGPVVISFTDGTEKSSRINEKTIGVQVEDKAGGVVVFKYEDLSPAVQKALGEENLKKRVDSFVRQGFDPSKNNVVELANEAWKRLMDGKIYAKTGAAKKEGGSGQKGRPFDAELWVETITIAWKQKMNTEFSVDQASALRAKLTSADKAERTKITNGYLADKTIKAAHLVAKYKRLQAEAKEGKVDADKSVDMAAAFG